MSMTRIRPLRLLAPILTIALVLALSCLAGCQPDNPNANSSPAGTWSLQSIDDPADNQTGTEPIDSLREYGYQMGITLNEDGSAVLSLYGEDINGTWEESSSSSITLSLDSESTQATIKDGKLTFELYGDTFTFAKADSSQ